MRRLASILVLSGVALAILSAVAISDPSSPIGWRNWTDDPWSRGLIFGAGLTLIGVLYGLGARVLSRRSQPVVVRLTVCAFAATAGSLLMAPLIIASSCADGEDQSVCQNDSWSTATGLSFEGEPTWAPALVVGFVSAGATWLLMDRRRSKPSEPAPSDTHASRSSARESDE
jgi:hypothetical protein